MLATAPNFESSGTKCDHEWQEWEEAKESGEEKLTSPEVHSEAASKLTRRRVEKCMLAVSNCRVLLLSIERCIKKPQSSIQFNSMYGGTAKYQLLLVARRMNLERRKGYQ